MSQKSSRVFKQSGCFESEMENRSLADYKSQTSTLADSEETSNSDGVLIRQQRRHGKRQVFGSSRCQGIGTYEYYKRGDTYRVECFIASRDGSERLAGSKHESKQWRYLQKPSSGLIQPNLNGSPSPKTNYTIILSGASVSPFCTLDNWIVLNKNRSVWTNDPRLMSPCSNNWATEPAFINTFVSLAYSNWRSSTSLEMGTAESATWVLYN